MTTSSSPRGRWAIKVLSPDESGVEFYLRQYKPFRLLALQESPSCKLKLGLVLDEEGSKIISGHTAFSSSYEREAAFSDNEWIQRVTNPIATTFVAVDEKDGKVLSSATLVGPLPLPDDPAVAEKAGGLPPGSLHWQLAAVYTRREARRSGLARDVLRAVWEWASEKSVYQGSSCIVTADVMPGNCGARSLYEGFGFSEAGKSDGNVRMMRCANKEARGS